MWVWHHLIKGYRCIFSLNLGHAHERDDRDEGVISLPSIDLFLSIDFSSIIVEIKICVFNITT